MEKIKVKNFKIWSFISHRYQNLRKEDLKYIDLNFWVYNRRTAEIIYTVKYSFLLDTARFDHLSPQNL